MEGLKIRAKTIDDKSGQTYSKQNKTWIPEMKTVFIKIKKLKHVNLQIFILSKHEDIIFYQIYFIV